MRTSSFFSLLTITVSSCLQVSAQRYFKRGSVEHLLSRQSTIGQQCNTQCAPFTNSLSTCLPSTCLCTASTAASLQVCINCAISFGPGTADSAQGVVDNYEALCAGKSIPSITISGGSTGSTSAGNSGGGGGVTITNSGAPTSSSSRATGPTTTISNGNLPSTTSTLVQVTIGPSSTPSSADSAQTTPAGNDPLGSHSGSSNVMAGANIGIMVVAGVLGVFIAL